MKHTNVLHAQESKATNTQTQALAIAPRPCPLPTDDDSDSESDEDSEDDDDDDDADGGSAGGRNASPAASGGSRFSLADIAAKAKQAVSSAPGGAVAGAAAQKRGVASPNRKGLGAGGAGAGGLVGGRKAAKLWARLLSLPRIVVQVRDGWRLRVVVVVGVVVDGAAVMVLR